ncbi:protein angel homolog 2 isoform X2 [Pristis pectinata]|nr:protein angel homolog 2 isoform X2 [Pristis pectinata]
MITRHLQNLGRNSIVRLSAPRWFCNIPNFSCPCRVSSFSPWVITPHGFGSPLPFHWTRSFYRNPSSQQRPPSFFYGHSWTRGSSLQQTFNSYPSRPSGYHMETHVGAPQVKRRKHDPANKKELNLLELNDTNHAAQDKTDCVALRDSELENSRSSSVVEGQENRNIKVGAVHRKWEDFTSLCKSSQGTSESKETSNEKQKEVFDFSVLSYNILAQDLLEDNSHLYRHCSQPLLQWGFRFPNILKELKQLDADIMCLQEVQNNHYGKQLKPILESLGYHCEYKMRTGNKRDGCAICFKRSKFSLISASPVEFYRPMIQILDRDNVGLVVLLQPALSQSDVRVCVANTHLLYNPRRGDIKLAQLAILLAEINKLASDGKGGHWPIILCGDFNSVPDSPLYNFIRSGKLIYDGLPIGKVSGQEQSHRGQRALSKPLWPSSLGISSECQYETMKDAEYPVDALDNSEELKDATTKKNHPMDQLTPSAIQHKFKLLSVYSHYLPGTNKTEVTTCHSKSAVTVDYIFYSAAKNNGTPDSGDGGHLQLLGKLALLTEQDLWTVNRLPNESNSSDHLPLLAKFRHKL